MNEQSPQEKVYSEKDTYTKEELYAVLTACTSRTRTDLIYHCRTVAEEMERDVAETNDSEATQEITSEIGVLRSIQTLASRADADSKEMES